MFDTFEVQRMSKHFSRDFGSNPYIFTPSIILEASYPHPLTLTLSICGSQKPKPKKTQKNANFF
jgi:hypothetical protein